MTSLHKFQVFLRELFQLDLADLDFGIYRLLHIKHREIEDFLDKQLPRRVTEAFERMSGDEAGTLKAEIVDLATKIREDVADDALLETGEVNPDYQWPSTKAAKRQQSQYAEKWVKLKSIQASDSVQNDVFNHLYAFFSRYYDNGDFIPRRRYGVRETYSVPYNGEETIFHWANRDQHYVKTGERFRDYAFTVDVSKVSYHIRFCLTEANLPSGNTKGDTRYFFPLPKQLIWESGDKTAVLPFHYRPASEADLSAYGNLKNNRLQETILTAAIPEMLGRIDNTSLRVGLLAPSDSNNPDSISILEKRLRHFCKKNTSDYFIHKDLARFLNREMEFYLKDQVVHLADLEGDILPRLRTIRVIKTLAGEIITFLTQIEEVQKRLFEKRKLVLRSDYIISIKEIPSSFWPEIYSNADQTAQWQTLFGIDLAQFGVEIDDATTIKFFETHPTLTIDTACFASDFTHRLLATFTDIDAAVDGLLIHSENYQGLRFLERKYAGKIKCLYIDPPYNTGNDGFQYKDNYQHSSWFSFLESRVRKSISLLTQDGVSFFSIDDSEASRFKCLLEDIYGENNFIEQIIWKKRSTPPNDKVIGAQHEYILSFAKHKEDVSLNLRKRSQSQIARYKNPDNHPKGPWTSGDLMANIKGGRYVRSLFFKIVNPNTGEEHYPSSNGNWRFSKDTIDSLLANNEIFFGDDGRGRPKLKRFLCDVKDGITYTTLWDFVPLNTQGSKEMSEMLGIMTAFENPKPTGLIKEINKLGTKPDSLILDYFAGSGTTAHAVINLNREDGGRRKFILVEMADYFDTVLLPRIRKVMYAPEWKDGQPKRLPTAEEADRTPHIIKVLRLESYEDALHNLVTEDTQNRETPRADAIRNMVGGDAYQLSYLVRLPLDANASMLHLDALDHPFNYQIEVLTNSGPSSQTVDLVETFNFLYGLYVERLETWVNPVDNRHYRAVLAKDKKRQKVLVLWRDMEGYDPVIERKFLEAKLQELAISFNECLINSDTATPGFRSLDGIFKQLVMEGER